MFEKQKQENQKCGLVLVKDKEVVEAYENKTFRGSVDTNTEFEGFNDAYFQGIEDGENFSISDKIAGEGENLLELEGKVSSRDLISKVVRC